MKYYLRHQAAFIILFLLSTGATAQTNTYILNGAASQNSCNCYTLTPASPTQSGSVWNANKINLNLPFDYIFNVFLGCADGTGADGIVFMLQPISTSVGTTGEGMGFEGISPSIGISLDTWQNTNRNDPAYDHISIQANGVITHGSDLAGPIQASASSDNIEDCQWHTLRIAWDPVNQSLSTYFDGQFRLEARIDLVGTIFNNDPMVFWGFSGGTGGSYNLQQFCTALNPNYQTDASNNAVCLGTPVSFSNSSESFAPIATYYWDLGDGTTYTIPNPPPHLYATPGLYPVKLAITGLDGCNSDTLRKTIAVGDFPVADFEIADTCAGKAPRLADASQVQVGSINSWNWTLDGVPYSQAQLPQLNGLTAGNHRLDLSVESNYGCASSLISKNFSIEPRPEITASGISPCVGDPAQLQASQLDQATTITSWDWSFGDNSVGTGDVVQHVYPDAVTYQVSVAATSNQGCVSDPVTLPISPIRVIANAGNDTIVVFGDPYRLQASASRSDGNITNMSYNWQPATDLDDPQLLQPIATPQNDIDYQLTVSTPEGCVANDALHITVFKGSAVYVPKAFTPNQDGLNDRIKPYYIGITKLAYFTVFNRWGEKVFSTTDLNAGWNGIYKGISQPTGAYVWMLEATDFVGKQYKLKGTTTLIR